MGKTHRFVPKDGTVKTQKDYRRKRREKLQLEEYSTSY